MGYTHHYRGWVSLDGDLLEEIQEIIDASEVEIKGWDGFGLPTIDEEKVSLNGTDADDEKHETFTIVHGVNHINFCKTAHKPYDEVVGAILLRVSHYNKRFKVSSDGRWDADEWAAPRALYVKVFGEEAERPEEIRVVSDTLV